MGGFERGGKDRPSTAHGQAKLKRVRNDGKTAGAKSLLELKRDSKANSTMRRVRSEPFTKVSVPRPQTTPIGARRTSSLSLSTPAECSQADCQRLDVVVRRLDDADASEENKVLKQEIARLKSALLTTLRGSKRITIGEALKYRLGPKAMDRLQRRVKRFSASFAKN